MNTVQFAAEFDRLPKPTTSSTGPHTMKMIARATALLLAPLAWTLSCPAQTANESPVEVDILHQEVIQQGGRTITYNIVTPPPGLLAARPQPEVEIPVTPLSQEELEALQEQEQKPVLSLIVEGSAYSNGVTEFRWHAGQKSYRAFSNVDFTLFSALTMLEGANSVYQFTFLVSRATGTPPPSVPDSSQFSSSQAEYMAVADQEHSIDAQQEAAAFAPFDALHVYFDTAKEDLIAARAAAEAERAAKEQALRDNPPQPKNITVNIWVERGTALMGPTNP